MGVSRQSHEDFRPGPLPSPDGGSGLRALPHPLGDGHAQAGPFRLGLVKKARRSSASARGEARAVVAHATRSAGCPSSSPRSHRISIRGDRSRRSGRYPGCSEDLSSRKGSAASVQVTRRPPRGARLPPRPPRLQVPHASRQTSPGCRRGPPVGSARHSSAHLEEGYRSSCAVWSRAMRLTASGGPRPQDEHLQAHLAAMQRVAALVAQAGTSGDGRQPLGLQRRAWASFSS